MPIASYSTIMYFFFIAVSVVWNGTVINGPILIYHDEILTTATAAVPTHDAIGGAGVLVCSSQTSRTARWRRPNGNNVGTSTTASFRQVISNSTAGLPSLSQLFTPNALSSSSSFIVNGLWVCQVFNGAIPDEQVLAEFNYVGIYRRNDGKTCHGPNL